MFGLDPTGDRETLAFLHREAARFNVSGWYPDMGPKWSILEKVCLTNQCILEEFLFSLLGWYIFSESDLGRHRLLRASLINGEWMRGRNGPLMFCPQTWTPLPSLRGSREIFQGASLVFIPHLSRTPSQSCLSLEGGQPLSQLPPLPSHPASTPKQSDQSPRIVSYGNQACGAPGGIALLSYIHFLPERKGIGEGSF